MLHRFAMVAVFIAGPFCHNLRSLIAVTPVQFLSRRLQGQPPCSIPNLPRRPICPSARCRLAEYEDWHLA